MKRAALYAAVLLAALLLPMERYDIGKLKPVEVVHMYKERNVVILKTDTGDLGMGKSVGEAYRNLKETTAGTIFLDTADYLLVEESAKGEIGAMGRWLKPSVRMCYAGRGIDLVAAAAYLRTHIPRTKLKENGSTHTVEELVERNGRMHLKIMEKTQKST